MTTSSFPLDELCEVCGTQLLEVEEEICDVCYDEAHLLASTDDHHRGTIYYDVEDLI